MDMSGEYRIPAPRQKVWEALNDPEVLRASIPGCEEIEKVSDTEMNARVRAKVGPVSARFAGTVTLGDMNPPESYTISGEGKGGAAGFAKGGAEVRLAEDGAEATVLTYTAQASVGGKLAQLGSRLIQGTAKKMADEFFGNFSAQLGGGRAVPGATVAAGEAAAPAAGAPEPEPAAALAAAPAAPEGLARERPEPTVTPAPAATPTPAAPLPAEPAPTAVTAAAPSSVAGQPQPTTAAPATPAAGIDSAPRTEAAPPPHAETVPPPRAEAPPPPPRTEPPRPTEPPRASARPDPHMAGGRPMDVRETLTHPLVVVSAAVVVLVLLFLIF